MEHAFPHPSFEQLVFKTVLDFLFELADHPHAEQLLTAYQTVVAVLNAEREQPQQVTPRHYQDASCCATVLAEVADEGGCDEMGAVFRLLVDRFAARVSTCE